MGAGRGLRIWLTVVVVFSACNIASGLAVIGNERELDLAVPFIVLGIVLVPYANRTGWGDLTTLAGEGTSNRDRPAARS